MNRGPSTLWAVTVLLLLFSGCSDPAPQAAEEHESNPAVSDLAARQAVPLVERYLEAAGISEAKGGGSPEGGEPTVRLFRSPEETEILKEIRGLEPDARLAILAAMVTAVDRHPSAVTRLEDVTHAVVGLDRALRSRVIETIVRPGSQEGSSASERRAAVQIGGFLQVDQEIPGFAETAVRLMLDTSAADDEEASLATSHRLSIYADRFSQADPLERCRLWAALLHDGRIDRAISWRLDAALLEQLAQADPKQVASDYGDLWNWFLERGRVVYPPALGGMDANTAADRKRRCAELFKAVVKNNPDVAAECLAQDTSGRQIDRLAREYPELLAALPEAVSRRVAEQEMEVFLAALEGRELPKAEGELRPVRPGSVRGEMSRSPEIPYLRLANEFLSDEQRQQLVAAIIERLKTSDDRQLTTLLQRLSAVGAGLTAKQCIAVLEMLEPSPFASEPTEPAVSSESYRAFAAAVPPAAADEVARWLFERIEGAAKLEQRYLLGLSEVAPACQPQTATRMMTYFCENLGIGGSRGLQPAAAALGKIVPDTEANALAEKLVAAAQGQPDEATAATQMRLAGLLQNADPQLRLQAFAGVLAKTGYDPAAGRVSSYGHDPRESLLAQSYSPALAAIAENLPPAERQQAFEKIMETLTGAAATREALVLVDSLIALSPHLSADDAQRAFETLVRLNTADTRQHREMPYRVTRFLTARVPEERPRLIKLLLPSVIGGQFQIKTYPATGSDPVSVMSSAAKELSSAGAREILGTMFDLLQQQEKGATTLFFFPYLDRIAAAERESLAWEILQRMQRSAVAPHAFVFGQSVARLGRDVSEQTRAAVADRLLDLLESHVTDLRARSWSVPREELYHQSFCGPLSELLKTLEHESAAPRRDRLVTVLCQVVYDSDSLPANAEIIALRGHREDFGAEVAQTLGATRAVVPPEMMNTVLSCVASLAMDIHPVAQKKMFDAFRSCDGTAAPGVGARLAQSCLSDAVGQYHPAMNIGSRDKIMEAIAPKLDDLDVMPVYRACWDTFRRSADSRGGSQAVSFGLCLKALARRVPAESAWPAVQDVLRRWPEETRPYHRKFLQELYLILYDRLPEENRQAVTQVAEQQGLTLQPVPTGSQPVSPAVKREASLEDLADEKTRFARLRQYLDTQRQLSLDERLALVQRLDEKGFLHESTGLTYESTVRMWFVDRFLTETSESIVTRLGQPDCVGLKQRLLTTALSRLHEGRNWLSELWEFADVLGAGH